MAKDLYTKTENGAVASKELKVQRLKSHYRDLFPLNETEESFKAKWPLLIKVSKEQDINTKSQKSNIVYLGKDLLKLTLLRMLTERAKFTSYYFASAYSLLDIYLGHNEDIPSISDLTQELIILTLGYSEFENRRQEDALMQLIDQQYIAGRQVWLMYNGQKNTFKSKYPNVYSLCQERGYSEITVDGVVSPTGTSEL